MPSDDAARRRQSVSHEGESACREQHNVRAVLCVEEPDLREGITRAVCNDNVSIVAALDYYMPCIKKEGPDEFMMSSRCNSIKTWLLTSRGTRVSSGNDASTSSVDMDNSSQSSVRELSCRLSSSD